MIALWPRVRGGLRSRQDTAPGLRPPVFRALGREDPPAEIRLRDEAYQRISILKHDSWAATAVYARGDRLAICKFNRRQPILIIPMRWLGRLLADRERRFMDRLAGIDGVPVCMGPVEAGGRSLPHAVSHEFISGHPLAEHETVGDDFFPRLQRTLSEIHGRGVAHVDLHKRENILVDDAGNPHLIDYQISFALPAGNRWVSALFGGALRVLQRCDDYHLLKHRIRHRPDQLSLACTDILRLMPPWIRFHRSIAIPFRTARRWLLTRLRIRATGGRAHSEAFPEIAFQGMTKRNLCSPH